MFARTTPALHLRMWWLLSLWLLCLPPGAPVSSGVSTTDPTTTVTSTSTSTIAPTTGLDYNVASNEAEQVSTLSDYERSYMVDFIAHQLYTPTELQRNRSMSLTFPAWLSNSTTTNDNNNQQHQQLKQLYEAQWRNLLNLFSKLDPESATSAEDDDGDESFNETSLNIIDITITPRPETVAILVGYGIVIVVSLVGNVLVCRVICSTPKLQTTTNILILSLTVSDILTAIFNIPFNCARILLNRWPLPAWFCIIMPTIQVASVYVSTFTMTAIGLHRYGSITLTGVGTANGNTTSLISTYTSKTKLSITIIAIWILSIFLALPHSIFNRVITGWYNYGTLHASRCRAVYPAKVERYMPLILSVSVTLTQFLIPLSITGVLYVRVARIIQNQGRLASYQCDELNRRMCEAKRRRIIMLCLVVASFTLCWLPLTVYHLLTDLHLLEFTYTLFLPLHLLAMSSICWNPFIYCWMNESFRQQVKKYFSPNNNDGCLIMTWWLKRIRGEQPNADQSRRSSPNNLLLVEQQMFDLKIEDGATDASCSEARRLSNETKVDQLTPVSQSKIIDQNARRYSSIF